MKKKNSQDLSKDILVMLLVTLFFAAASYILSLHSVRQQVFDISKWQTFLKTNSWPVTMTFISCLVLINACGLPRIWVCAIVGAVYGAVLGICLAQLITLIGATLNFYFGRWLLRGPLIRRIPDRYRTWYDHYSGHGFSWVLSIRLFPFGNATVVSLLSGASRMTYQSFLAATFLGYLPLTIIFGLFGSSTSHRKPLQLITGAILFVIFLAGRWIYKRRHLTQNGLP